MPRNRACSWQNGLTDRARSVHLTAVASTTRRPINAYPRSYAGVSRRTWMIHLTFPDNSVRDFAAGITGREVAEGISKSLAKKAVAMALDGSLADLADPIEADARIEIVTRDDPRALRAHPPRRRACHGRGRAGALPRHPGHHRSGDRERLLLRFLPQRALHHSTICRRSKRRCTRSSSATRPSPRRSGRATTPSASSPTRARCSRSSWSTPFPRTSRSRSTSRATGSTCAAARTWPRPGRSAPPSS